MSTWTAAGSLCGRVFCNEADEMWGILIHVQAFIQKNIVKHRQGQTSVNSYVEGKTQEYSESMCGSSIGEQYPKGLTIGVIRVHEQ